VHISPDGQRVSVNIFSPRPTALDLWLYDLEAENLTRLTFGGGNGAATWTQDGRLIYAGADSVAAFLTGRSEVRHVPADQSAAPATLLAASDRGALMPTSISRDGTTLAGTWLAPGTTRDVVAVTLSDAWVADLGGAGEPRNFVPTGFDESNAAFSPDGRYVAYTSNESGREEIYVVPYPGPGSKSPVSRGGGTFANWNPNGRELFYVSADNELMAVNVDTTGGFRALSTPNRLFVLPPFFPDRGFPYDVSADGTRFLVIKPTATQQAEIRIVVNWIDEIERAAQ
jgi:serine/threonine-protein kinase